MRWRLKSPASWLFTQPFIWGDDQSKHQSSASLAFMRGIHRWPVNSPQKGTIMRKMFPFDDVIMQHHRCCCLLFIIYMNAVHNASSKFHAILFVKDKNLTSTLCSFDVGIDNNCSDLQLSTNINKELKNIQIGLEINKLSLNVKKTK